MPLYKDQQVDGTCEKFVMVCREPEHFTKKADQYDAKPAYFEGEIEIGDGQKSAWSFWGLEVPERSEKLIRKTFRDQDIPVGFLSEFPCWLECPFMLAGFKDEEE